MEGIKFQKFCYWYSRPQADSWPKTVFSLLQRQKFIPYFELQFILRISTINNPKSTQIWKDIYPLIFLDLLLILTLKASIYWIFNGR